MCFKIRYDVINATLIPSFQLSFSFLSAFLFICLKGPIGGSFASIFFFTVKPIVSPYVFGIFQFSYWYPLLLNSRKH